MMRGAQLFPLGLHIENHLVQRGVQFVCDVRNLLKLFVDFAFYFMMALYRSRKSFAI